MCWIYVWRGWVQWPERWLIAVKPKNAAVHSSEIAWALHTINMWNCPGQMMKGGLETIMSDCWVNFAATGNPNGNNLPQWLPV